MMDESCFVYWLTTVEPTATPAAVDAIFAKSPGVGCAGSDGVAAEAGGGFVGTWLLGCEGFAFGVVRLAVVLAGLENADDLPLPDLDLRGILFLCLHILNWAK